MSLRWFATDRRTYSSSSSRSRSRSSMPRSGCSSNVGTLIPHGSLGRVPSEASLRRWRSAEPAHSPSRSQVSRGWLTRYGRIANSAEARFVIAASALSEGSGSSSPESSTQVTAGHASQVERSAPAIAAATLRTSVAKGPGSASPSAVATWAIRALSSSASRPAVAVRRNPRESKDGASAASTSASLVTDPALISSLNAATKANYDASQSAFAASRCDPRHRSVDFGETWSD